MLRAKCRWFQYLVYIQFQSIVAAATMSVSRALKIIKDYNASMDLSRTADQDLKDAIAMLRRAHLDLVKKLDKDAKYLMTSEEFLIMNNFRDDPHYSSSNVRQAVARYWMSFDGIDERNEDEQQQHLPLKSGQPVLPVSTKAQDARWRDSDARYTIARSRLPMLVFRKMIKRISLWYAIAKSWLAKLVSGRVIALTAES